MYNGRSPGIQKTASPSIPSEIRPIAYAAGTVLVWGLVCQHCCSTKGQAALDMKHHANGLLRMLCNDKSAVYVMT